MLIQSMEHSYMVVSGKYTNLNWRNNTQCFPQTNVFLKNFLKIRKNGFVKKNKLCVTLPV